MSAKRAERYKWKAERVRALRKHMDLTQRQFADEINTEQQRISEWETGLHLPSRLTATLLTMVAERSGFDYAGPDSPDESGGITLEEFRHLPVTELELSIRATDALKQAGLTEIGQVLDLLAQGGANLRAVPDFGRRSLDELKSRLDERGFSY
jgi:transcriptional regulator with XRE-family HTH domain